jgi:hypothetical protein
MARIENLSTDHGNKNIPAGREAGPGIVTTVARLI